MKNKKISLLILGIIFLLIGYNIEHYLLSTLMYMMGGVITGHILAYLIFSKK